MNRSNYFDYIEEKLSFLVYRIKQRGKINLLNLNIHSENFFADFFNLLFDYELENQNAIEQNCEAIDLIDIQNKVIVQVSSNCTKAKINSALSSLSSNVYDGYKFIFIALKDDAANLASHSYVIPSNITFSATSDIYDVKHILTCLLTADIDRLKRIFELVKKELGNDIDIVKLDTNLATVINILSKENLSHGIDKPEVNTFEIEKKIDFNNLQEIKDIIDEYVIYFKKVDTIYKEFDSQGTNKSLSVLNLIKTQYVRLEPDNPTPSKLFYQIIDAVIDIVQSSKNYKEIPYDELQLVVNIIIVDAFIRCKIFKNPQGYSYAITR